MNGQEGRNWLHQELSHLRQFFEREKKLFFFSLLHLFYFVQHSRCPERKNFQVSHQKPLCILRVVSLGKTFCPCLIKPESFCLQEGRGIGDLGRFAKGKFCPEAQEKNSSHKKTRGLLLLIRLQSWKAWNEERGILRLKDSFQKLKFLLLIKMALRKFY